jgi:hypothetical protein
MSTVTQSPLGARQLEPARRGVPAVPELWGAVAIGVMWMAVLFSAVYGGDFVSQNGSQTQVTTIPSAVFVSFFAFLASSAVAKRAFRREGGSRS